MRFTGGESGAMALPVDSEILGGSGSGRSTRPLSGDEGLSMELSSESGDGAVAGPREGRVGGPLGLLWAMATAANNTTARMHSNFITAPLAPHRCRRTARAGQRSH